MDTKDHLQTLEHIYRPRVFSEVIGQPQAISLLETVFDRETPPQVFCLHGHSGTGKTTVGRIICRHVGCVNPYEINTADTRGIDTARKINKAVGYKTLSKNPRVFIINECHKATVDFWNALLETLEEPPPNTYFVLCTTEPEKLLNTVRGRCKMIKFNPLKPDDLSEIIEIVLEKEGIDLSTKTIRKIISASNGSARDALVILDNVIDMGDGDDLDSVISGALIGDVEIIELCKALIKKATWAEIVELLIALKTSGKEAESIRLSIAGYFETILKNSKKLPKENLTMAAALFATESFIYTKHPALTVACIEATRILAV